MTSMLPNYMYDNEGKRTVKQHGGNEAVYTNSAEAGVRTEAPHYSLYANPYFVMNDGDKYTEHIYIGSERIAVRVAKLSDESSVLGNFDEEEMAGQGIVVGGIDYGVKRKAQEQVIEDCYDSLQFAYLLVDRRDLVNISMVPSDADTSDADDSDDERGTANPDTEWKKVYYYCTDHIGSTRLVLDDSARIAERLMFLPTGEVFMDERNTTLYHSDFLFSGKELDAETGNYYFDARYLAPRLGIWLSPDPLQLKYPHVSSYAYCMGNPVNRIDFDGNDSYYTVDGHFIESDNKSSDLIFIRKSIYDRPVYNQYTGWVTSLHTIDVPLSKIDLKAEAYSNIFTDILSKVKGVDITDLHNNRVSVQKIEYDYDPHENIPYYFGEGYNDAPHISGAVASIGTFNYNFKQRLTAYIHPMGSDERNLYSSVSNIVNLLGVHEYLGHFKNKIKNHTEIFNLQKMHPSWINTTADYKKYENDLYNKE